MRTLTAASALALSLALALPPLAAHAHEDMRLQAWLNTHPATVTSDFEHAQVYAQLGNLWKELGDAPKSSDLFARSDSAAKRVQDDYIRDVLKAHLANELASSGHYDDALQALDKVQDTDVWVKTAWKLIGKFAKAKQPERAAKLLEQAEARTRTVEEPLLRAELLSGTGAAYRYVAQAKGENLVYESYGMAQMLPDLYERGVMLNEAGAHLVDIGHREQALAVFDAVDRLAPQIENPLQQAQVLAMLGGEMAEKNLRDRAVGALDKGREVALSLPEGEERSAVLSEISRNYGQSHRFEPGIALAEKIADPYHRIEGFIRNAKNMARTGQQDAAYKLLERSEQEADLVKSPYLRATVLRKLASERIEARQPEQAKELLSRAERALAGAA